MHSRWKSTLLVVGAMVSGWAIAWLTLELESEPARQYVVPEATPADLAEVEREIAQIRRELAAQRGPSTTREIIREVEVPHRATDTPEILEQDPDTLSPAQREQWEAAEREHIESVFNRFDERLANEERDPDWAPVAEAHIEGVARAMREQGFSTTQLLSSECGTGTCRAEFSHADPAEQVRFLHEFVPQPDGEFVQADVRIVVDDDGSLRTEAFFVRHGHDVG